MVDHGDWLGMGLAAGAGIGHLTFGSTGGRLGDCARSIVMIRGGGVAVHIACAALGAGMGGVAGLLTVTFSS